MLWVLCVLLFTAQNNIGGRVLSVIPVIAEPRSGPNRVHIRYLLEVDMDVYGDGITKSTQVLQLY